MPPPDFAERSRVLTVNGLQMKVHESGREDAPPIVFCHGFPQIAYAWRHQLADLSKLGYRAIAPDLRGYGETTAPPHVDDYRMTHLVKDMVGLLQALGIPRATFVGHDMGSMLVYALRAMVPQVCRGVVSLNLPIREPQPVNPIERMAVKRGGNHYMVTFQKPPDPRRRRPGVAEDRLEADVRKTFEALMRTTAHTPDHWDRTFPAALEVLPIDVLVGEPAIGERPVLPPNELDVYVRTFQETGFTGAINWYRNLGANWRDARRLQHKMRDEGPDAVEAAAQYTPPARPPAGDVPILLLRGTLDPVTRAVAAEWMMKAGLPLKVWDLECGHWTHEERPADVSLSIHRWIAAGYPTDAPPQRATPAPTRSGQPPGPASSAGRTRSGTTPPPPSGPPTA